MIPVDVKLRQSSKKKDLCAIEFNFSRIILETQIKNQE